MLLAMDLRTAILKINSESLTDYFLGSQVQNWQEKVISAFNFHKIVTKEIFALQKNQEEREKYGRSALNQRQNVNEQLP